VRKRGLLSRFRWKCPNALSRLRLQQLDGLSGLPPVHVAVVVGRSPPIELVRNPGGVSAARAHEISVALVAAGLAGAPLRASVSQAVETVAVSMKSPATDRQSGRVGPPT
jgi:hypothetical protein